MSKTTYDAKEAMTTGSVYDRSRQLGYQQTNQPAPPIGFNNHQSNHVDYQAQNMYTAHHDPMSYISSDRSQCLTSNMAVPVGMFMNMTNIPPRFFNQHQQTCIAAKQSRKKVQTQMNDNKSFLSGTQKSRIASISHGGPYTQGLSENMSQPGFSLSQQPDFSQDYLSEFQSQGDGLLSQNDHSGSQNPAFGLPPAPNYSQPY